jgi:hypothetical protein
MTITITATYEDTPALSNVLDDLINHGLEREKIYRDDDKMQIKVIIPRDIEPEIRAILKRHHPVVVT